MGAGTSVQKDKAGPPSKEEMMKKFKMSEEEYEEVAKDMDMDLSGQGEVEDAGKSNNSASPESLFEGIVCDPRIGAVTADEAINTIAISYNGSATTPGEDLVSWVLGPRFAPFDSPERMGMCDFYGKYGFASCSRKGKVIGLRDPETKEVLGVMLLRRGPESDLEVYRTMMKAGYPPHLKKNVYGKEPVRRESAVLKGQKKLALKGPQYLLYNLAIKPEHQGKGCGGALVRALIALGEKEKVPVCVYVSERLEAFYTHLGFEQQQLAEVADPSGQEGSGPLRMVCMVRNPPS